MNKIDSFIKQSVGSRGNIFDITSRISPSGDFQRIKNIEVILSSWDVILRTPEGSYDNDPEFGSNLMRYIFQPADDTTLEQVRNEIFNKLSMYDDRAKVVSVVVGYLVDRKGFNVEIEVDYKGNKESLKAIIDETMYFDFLKQT